MVHRGPALVAFGASGLAVVVSAVIPLIIRSVVDVIAATHGGPPTRRIALLLLAAAALFGLGWARRYFGGRLALAVQHDLRTALFGAVVRLSASQQARLDTGGIIGRATSDLQLITALLSSLPMLGGSLVLFIGSLAVMFALSPLLTVISLVMCPVLAVLAAHAGRRVLPASRQAQQRAATIAGIVDSAVAGVRVLRSFGREADEQRRLEGASARLYRSRMRSIRLKARYQPAIRAIPSLGLVAILAVGGRSVVEGRVTLGTLVAFASYLIQLTVQLGALMTGYTAVLQATAGMERLLHLIDERPLVQQRPDSIELGPQQGGHALEFDRVTFRYAPADGPALYDLSLTLAPGETLAVVGPSGSGKSTLAVLAARNYDPDTGVVRVNGHDVRGLALGALRHGIAVAHDDGFLFHTSIRDNIAYGRPDATDMEVVAAARTARADDFITELPDGYATLLGERGLSLSGGQRQRILLARAVLNAERLLVLDDATSAVDAVLEAEIHRTLRTAMTGRSMLLITHRAATLQFADRIAVLDQGRLVDLGTDEELRGRCPLYGALLADSAGSAECSGPDGVERVEAAAVGIQPAPALAGPASSLRLGVAAGSRTEAGAIGSGRLLAPFVGGLAAGLVLIVLDTAGNLALPAVISRGIDVGVAPGSLSGLAAAVAGALALVLGAWLVQSTSIRLTGRTGEGVLQALRVRMFAHLQRLDLGYFEQNHTGRILTLLTTDVDALAGFVQSGLLTAVASLLGFVGVLAALIAIDRGLAAVVLAPLPLLLLATVLFQRRTSAQARLARERTGALTTYLRDSLGGLRTIQEHAQEDRAVAEFTALSSLYRDARMPAQRAMALYFPFVQFLAAAVSALVLLVGARRIGASLLTVGGLVAYLLYTELLFAPLQQLSQVSDDYQQAAAGLARIAELLRTPAGTPAEAPVRVERLGGEICFEDVHFRYPAQSAEALAGVDLRIAAGETVAIVGETGAGKSTLAKLVSGFYEATSGTVSIDGVDIRGFDLATYRQRLGVVWQEPYLFAGTVRDAIALARPGAGDDQIEAAARAVGAHDMITALSDGYQHRVEERGRNLSTGQHQLIALARAELRMPDILILDEATSRLDPVTEAQVQRAAEACAYRRTTLVIAHRLSTAARADRVVVMAHGRVVEEGPHGELLAAGGAYARLWQARADSA